MCVIHLAKMDLGSEKVKLRYSWLMSTGRLETYFIPGVKVKDLSDWLEFDNTPNFKVDK